MNTSFPKGRSAVVAMHSFTHAPSELMPVIAMNGVKKKFSFLNGLLCFPLFCSVHEALDMAHERKHFIIFLHTFGIEMK